MKNLTRCRRDEAGFTIIEVLIATFLMALVLTALATVTSQWMPNWNRGMTHMQQTERLSVGLDRIASDLAAAEYVPLNGTTNIPVFEGGSLSLTFVRTSVGLNSHPGLEFVRFSERADRQGLALVREHAPFVPAETGTPIPFGNLVVLIRAPYRITFSYAGSNGTWQGEWQPTTELPRRIRIAVREAVSDRVLVASTAVDISVNAPAACVRAKDIGRCLATGQFEEPAAPPGAPTANPATNPALNPPASGN